METLPLTKAIQILGSGYAVEFDSEKFYQGTVSQLAGAILEGSDVKEILVDKRANLIKVDDSVWFLHPKDFDRVYDLIRSPNARLGTPNRICLLDLVADLNKYERAPRENSKWIVYTSFGPGNTTFLKSSDPGAILKKIQDLQFTITDPLHVIFPVGFPFTQDKPQPPKSGLGATCGTIAGLGCGSGYQCQLVPGGMTDKPGVCLSSEQGPTNLPGGWTEWRSAETRNDLGIQDMKPEIEEQLGRSIKYLTPLRYRSQVVAGVKYRMEAKADNQVISIPLFKDLKGNTSMGKVEVLSK